MNRTSRFSVTACFLFALAGCGGTGGDSQDAESESILNDISAVTDSDNDGVSDAVEGVEDLDNDGVPNYLDLDSDGDFISDAHEYNHPCSEDFDTQRGIHGTPTAEREFPQQNERVPLVINEYWYADQQMIVRFTSIETDDFCNVETIENATLWD